MSAGVGRDPVEQPISRKGYFLKDLARSFLQVLGETDANTSAYNEWGVQNFWEILKLGVIK